jgi:hypothetical protein
VSISIAHTYRNELEGVAKRDVEGILVKDAAYGGSWKKRGGIGAYMMMCRKWDRLEKAVEQDYGYDIFAAIEKDPREESVLDDIRDLRCYLLLIEAEIQARRTVQDRARVVDRGGPVSIEITGVGIPDPWGAVPTPNKYVSPPGVTPPMIFNPPSTVSRTETLPQRPNTASRIESLPPQTTTIAEVPTTDTSRTYSVPLSNFAGSCEVANGCPCGDSGRPGHPDGWCQRESVAGA